MNNDFEKYGALHIKNILPVDFCKFFTHVLMRKADLDSNQGDQQVPNAKARLDHEYMFDTLQEKLWSVIEDVIGDSLIPTYSYARLYNNGDVLKRHTDRPACEVSVTIQLGRSHNNPWSIYMGGNKYDLDEGDGVIYKGCEVEHWREECKAPEGYYSGQVFLHYVKKNGAYASEVGDSSFRNIYSYMKNRTYLMENK